jgi:uncharacterized protein (DUF433 family)
MAVDLVASRVTENPQVRSGQPIIRGRRITVWDILGWLGGGPSEPEILNDYPELRSEDIKALYSLLLRLQNNVNLQCI